jgi:holo-[acyl-carrier protein] synthase
LFRSGDRALEPTSPRPVMHLAARFCAKEAVAKALQLREWSWRDVEVLGGGDVPPSVRLTGAAAEKAAELGATVTVSLTHTHGMAAAVAVAS